jgi:hypothetical protein
MSETTNPLTQTQLAAIRAFVADQPRYKGISEFVSTTVPELVAEVETLRGLLKEWREWADDQHEWRGFAFDVLASDTRAYLDAVS